MYQLQQEAPHPRRLTCTCEVRTWVLPFCLWLQSSSIDWRVNKLHPEWVVSFFKVAMDLLGVIFLCESNLVYLRMFWATPHSHHGRAPFHQSHSKSCWTFLFHFMNRASWYIFTFISTLWALSTFVLRLIGFPPPCVDPDSYFIHAQNRNGGARSGSATKKKQRNAAWWRRMLREGTAAICVAAKQTCCCVWISFCLFFLIQKISVLFYGLEQRLE